MVIVTLPYGDWVVSAEDALTLMNIFAKSERYQEKYQRDSDNTHHVWVNDGKMNFHAISDDLYQMAKLAGKPPKD